MIICEVMAGDEEGGLENHFIDLCNGLSSQHQVHVIAHERYRSRFNARVNYHHLDLSKGRNNPFLWWLLLRQIRSISPDVLHVHASKGAVLISRIRRWIACPVVATIHSLKRKTAMFEGFDQLIAVSRGVAEPIHNPRLEIIYNGRALIPAVKTPKNAGQDPIILCVARLEDVKGVDLLLTAMLNVEKGQLWIAGDGSLRDKLQLQAINAGLAERVQFLGNRDDIGELILKADLLVIPSRREGFPLVLVEALLLRCPVVSTRVPGASEILPPELLVDIADTEQLGQKINALLAEPDRLAILSQPLFEFAEEKLTFGTQLKQTEMVLRRTAELNR